MDARRADHPLHELLLHESGGGTDSVTFTTPLEHIALRPTKKTADDDTNERVDLLRHYRSVAAASDNGDAPTSHPTRDEAVDEIRKLFEAGLAQRGEFYIVERDREGRVVRVFDVDDELTSAAARAS